MMKKMLSVALCLLVVCFCLLPAFGLEDCGTISVRLNSDVAERTKNDVQALFALRSGNVTYGIRGGEPIQIADYGGTEETGRLVAGRTYTVSYTLSAADGYVLPQQLDDNNLQISCGKGVSVISRAIVSARVRTDDGSFDEIRGVRIFAKLTVDGNVFQRFIGRIHDLILKAKAWSLY
ncbi:MAG: hypothetical protein II804_00570 [Clostridia bacterium]|nr:hypothetical protein [Clostridia bacterium]